MPYVLSYSTRLVTPRGIAMLVLTAGFLGMQSVLNAQDIDEEVATAVRLLEQGEIGAAEERLRALVESDPRDGETRYLLGRALYLGEEFEGAVEEFELAVELRPEVSDYYVWFGRTQIELLERASFLRQPGHARAALGAFEKAVELDPSSVYARDWLAGYYWNAPGITGGSTDKALEQVDVVRQLNAAAGHRLMGFLLFQKESYPEALEEYREFVATDPASATAEDWSIIGRSYEETGEQVQAVQAYENAIGLDPGNQRAEDGLARLGGSR